MPKTVLILTIFLSISILPAFSQEANEVPQFIEQSEFTTTLLVVIVPVVVTVIGGSAVQIWRSAKEKKIEYKIGIKKELVVQFNNSVALILYLNKNLFSKIKDEYMIEKTSDKSTVHEEFKKYFEDVGNAEYNLFMFTTNLETFTGRGILIRKLDDFLKLSEYTKNQMRELEKGLSSGIETSIEKLWNLTKEIQEELVYTKIYPGRI